MSLERTSSQAIEYHRETKYSPQSLREICDIDWSRQPYPFKEYHGACHVDLSAYVPLSSNPFADVPIRKPSQWAPDERKLAELSRILYFTNGVTAIVPYPPNPLLMRAAPSAGGLYPNEIYVLTNNFDSHLGSCTYNYQVKTQSLAQISEGDHAWQAVQKACLGQVDSQSSDLILVISAVFERSSWRYRDRAYRRILLDTGHILGNLSLVAPQYGRSPQFLGGFLDDEVNKAMGFHQEEEQALFVVSLASSDDSASELRQALPSPSYPWDPQVPDGYRLAAVHEASKISGVPSANLDTDESAQTHAIPLSSGVGIDCKPLAWTRCSTMKTIQERRSCRRLSREGITDDQLFKILVFASQFELLTGTQIKNYLLVRDVSGIEAGCYLFRGDSRKLHQVRFRDLQGEAHSVCLGQNLARDAAAIVVQVASLEDAVKEYGERAYRYLHFDAGLISQRLNLAAVAQGLGATSIGGFFDDMANDMLGIAAEDAVLHITCLGVKPDQDEGQVSKIGY